MQSEENNNQEALFHQLKQLGFDEENILKALKITNDIEKASEIILKLGEEGPNADLSAYLETPKIEPKIDFFPTFPLAKSSKAKMLFIVNGQLKMGKGKICAQVGHAVIGAYLQIQEQARYDERSRARLENWETFGSAKIVVKCEKEREMFQIKKKLEDLNIGINLYLVQDAGHTQIKAGSKTILGVGPAFSEQIDPVTHHLKLL